MRVATYTRISTDEDHQPYSLEAQAERLGNYVASQDGWELIRRFSDQASGATTERPGLQRALSGSQGQSLRPAPRLPGGPIRSLGAGSGPAPRRTRCRRGRVPLGHRALRHHHAGGEDDGPDARRLSRVRASHDCRPGDHGHGTQGRSGGWCGGSRPFGYASDPATGFLVPIETERIGAADLALLRPQPRRCPICCQLAERGRTPHQGRTAVEPYFCADPASATRSTSARSTSEVTCTRHRMSTWSSLKLFERVQAMLSEGGEDYSKRASATSDYLLAGLHLSAALRQALRGQLSGGQSLPLSLLHVQHPPALRHQAL